MTEFADLRSSSAHLCLFIDDCCEIFARRGVEGEDRPTILNREERGERVHYQPRAELRFEWINKHLRVPIEKPMGCVPAVLVHCSDHQELEIVHHGFRLSLV